MILLQMGYEYDSALSDQMMSKAMEPMLLIFVNLWKIVEKLRLEFKLNERLLGRASSVV